MELLPRSFGRDLHLSQSLAGLQISPLSLLSLSTWNLEQLLVSVSWPQRAYGHDVLPSLLAK